MKKKILLIASVFIFGYTSAQQLMFNSQYMINQFLINPAAAGTSDGIPLGLSFRQQWAGFNDAPSTQMFSGHASVGKHMGLGGILYNDVTGPLRNLGFEGAYSFRFNVSDNTKLSMGLAFSASQHILDGSKFILNDETDATLNGAKLQSFNPDASFGTYYYGDNFFVGISVPQLFENKYKFGDDLSKFNKQVRHYYFSSGFRFALGKDYELEPSLLVKAVTGAPIQADVNLKLLYKENLWLGASYRHEESVVALLGIQRDRFLVGYAHDFTLSRIKNYSAGTHELYIQYTINGDKKSPSSM